MANKTNQDLLMEYLKSASDLERARAEVENLEKQTDNLRITICNTQELVDVLGSTGVRTYDDKFVFLENANIQVSDYQPIPCAWELDNDQ